MSEVLVIIRLINIKIIYILVLGGIVFIAALYNFVLYNMVNHGQDIIKFSFVRQIKKVELNFLMLIRFYPFIFITILTYFLI